MSNPKKYRATPGAQFTQGQAQTYGAYIDELSRESGSVTPEALIEASRDMKSPTHSYFEWNDRKAAARHRMVQARHLLSHIAVVVRTGGKVKPVRAFFNVKEAPVSGAEEKSVYVSVNRAFSEEHLKKQVLQEAWAELMGWKERYHTYKELGPIVKAIEVFGRKRKF